MKNKKLNALERARQTLNDICEKEWLDEKDAPKIKSVRFFRQDNFTGVLVNNEFLGMTKRNNNDKHRQYTADCFAISRAIRAMVHNIYGR